MKIFRVVYYLPRDEKKVLHTSELLSLNMVKCVLRGIAPGYDENELQRLNMTVMGFFKASDNVVVLRMQ